MRANANASGWLLVFGVFLSTVASRSSTYFRWAPFLNMVLFVVLIWFMICIHEAIHGLTARTLGGRVFEMALGAGRIRYRVSWRGTRFSLRQGLFLGLCISAFPRRSHIRLPTDVKNLAMT